MFQKDFRLVGTMSYSNQLKLMIRDCHCTGSWNAKKF